MKKLISLILFISAFSHAEESCLFPPCPEPPTEEEFKAVDEMFSKVKYALGGAYDVQNKSMHPEIAYKNIRDFVNRTKKLKQDIKVLESEAKLLNRQAGGFDMVVAIGELELCVSFDSQAMKYCHQSLNTLKTYFWGKHFDTDWSGYPSATEWAGFPQNVQ